MYAPRSHIGDNLSTRAFNQKNWIFDRPMTCMTAYAMTDEVGRNLVLTISITKDLPIDQRAYSQRISAWWFNHGWWQKKDRKRSERNNKHIESKFIRLYCYQGKQNNWFIKHSHYKSELPNFGMDLSWSITWEYTKRTNSIMPSLRKWSIWSFKWAQLHSRASHPMASQYILTVCDRRTYYLSAVELFWKSYMR